MKNLLLTLHINLPVAKGFLSFQHYCKKYNIDLVNITNPSINYVNVYFEKMIFLDYLNDYDRILYLDSDIIITPHSPNIFEHYADTNFFYAYHENDFGEQMDRDVFIKTATDRINWPKEKNNKFRYFNAGVMLFSKKHRECFINFKEEIDNNLDLMSFGDQTILNYIAVKNNLPFKSIDYDWNRLSLGNYDPYYERLSSNFIHYAGPDYYGGNGNKNLTMEQDFKILYG